jgi:hypothetical protein
MSSVLSDDDPQNADDTIGYGTAEGTQGHTRRQTGIAAITNAIDPFRRSRLAEERHRAARERKTIIVLMATALFALLAAIAAIVSGVIFQGQLAEMQTAGADARGFSQAQLRAYITVAGLEIERGDPNRTPGGRLESEFWMARPEIENSGRTPTRNLRWIMGPTVTTVPIDKVPDIMPKVDEKQAAGGGWTYGTLGPRSRMNLDYPANASGLAEQIFLQIAHGEGRLLFTGILRYNDIFPNSIEQITKFCYFIRADILDTAKLPPGTPLQLSDLGHPYGRQCGGRTNCTDEECNVTGAQSLK